MCVCVRPSARIYCEPFIIWIVVGRDDHTMKGFKTSNMEHNTCKVAQNKLTNVLYMRLDVPQIFSVCITSLDEHFGSWVFGWWYDWKWIDLSSQIDYRSWCGRYFCVCVSVAAAVKDLAERIDERTKVRGTANSPSALNKAFFFYLYRIQISISFAVAVSSKLPYQTMTKCQSNSNVLRNDLRQPRRGNARERIHTRK